MRARAELNEELGRALEIRWVQIRPKVVERVRLLAHLVLHGNLREATVHAEAIALAHKLSGGLGTFGRHEASALAAEIESRLVATEGHGTPSSAPEGDVDLVVLQRLVTRLVACIGSR
jgi:HPt (histidine-containing phosphotransfer) domain-containing protein